MVSNQPNSIWPCAETFGSLMTDWYSSSRLLIWARPKASLALRGCFMTITFVNKAIGKVNDVLDKVQTSTCFSAKKFRRNVLPMNKGA